MSKETLEVEKKAVVELYDTAGKKGKNVLVALFGATTFERKITERIKTVRDAFQYNKLDYDEFLKSCDINADTPDEIAYKELKVIVKALNEGTVFDWGDSNQPKYYPWFDMGGSSGSSFAYYDYDRQYSDSACGSRLCFKSRELAEYAAKQFTDIYKKYFLI